MPAKVPTIDKFKHFYWGYRNIAGAPHPQTMEWDLGKKEMMDACREVQMGNWKPHDTPCSPENCDHPETAEHAPSIAHRQTRISYVYCGRCGQPLDSYRE